MTKLSQRFIFVVYAVTILCTRLIADASHSLPESPSSMETNHTNPRYRVFTCLFNERSDIKKVFIAAEDPNHFPENYKHIVFENKSGAKTSYVLQLVEGGKKGAVWRFLLGMRESFLPPEALYGIFAWNPGSAQMYIDITAPSDIYGPPPPNFTYAGNDRTCKSDYTNTLPF